MAFMRVIVEEVEQDTGLRRVTYEVVDGDVPVATPDMRFRPGQPKDEVAAALVKEAQEKLDAYRASIGPNLFGSDETFPLEGGE